MFLLKRVSCAVRFSPAIVRVSRESERRTSCQIVRCSCKVPLGIKRPLEYGKQEMKNGTKTMNKKTRLGLEVLRYRVGAKAHKTA